MKVDMIIQARMGSERLPGKVLSDLAGVPALTRVLTQARACATVDEIVVATTVEPEDDAIAELCSAEGWACFRGSEQDVLDRYYQVALQRGSDQIVRVTADCPLLCPGEADRVVRAQLETGV